MVPIWVYNITFNNDIYRQISNISGIKSQTLIGFRLILQLPLPNLLKPGVKSMMKI